MVWLRPLEKADFASLRFVGAQERELLPQLVERTDRLVVLGAQDLNQAPAWITAEMRPQEREWPVPRWLGFLAAEGVPAQARTSDQPVRHRLRAFFKALVVRPGVPLGATFTRAVGLPLEVVPLAEAGGGNLLAVRLVHNGKPVVGVRLTAVAIEAAASSSAVTDAAGETRVALPAPGDWLISAVIATPSAVAGFETDILATTTTLRR